MKNMIFPGLLILASSLNVSATEANGMDRYVSFVKGGIKVQLSQYCIDNSLKACVFNYKDITVKAECEEGIMSTSGEGKLQCNGQVGRIVVSSSHSFKSVHFDDHMGQFWGQKNIFSPLPDSSLGTKDFDFEEAELKLIEVRKSNGVAPTFKDIVVKFNAPNNLHKSMVKGKSSLTQAFETALDRSLSFQSSIAKSHQGHVERYIQSLRDGISVLTSRKDYSILNWRVLESSRRIVAFGFVVSELLEEYSHVENLQEQIKSISSLTHQLKKSYGWDKELVGGTSKASGALLELMELQLSKILMLKISTGDSDFIVYTDLIKETKKLMNKVNSTKSGDMATQREIFDLLDAWNSPGWQKELTNLIRANTDFNKSVAKKLSILLMTVDSIRDMSKMNFIVPIEIEERS